MKHQYFGDVNDYRKYGLLRILSGGGRLSTGVCWMLTPADKRTDGNFTQFLHQPDPWRDHDRELFEFLQCCLLQKKRRHLDEIERTSLLSNTHFFSRVLEEDCASRKRYFADMHDQFLGKELVFFDPDNGMEIKSRAYRPRPSCKHLYWHEVEDTFQRGHSLLIYQHFIRANREQFIARRASELKARTGAAVYSFRTARVVFFLCSQPRHRRHFRGMLPFLERQWKGQIVPQSF